jgi:hypothetical protein
MLLSRPSTKLATFERPIHGAWNSDRKVMTASTGRLRNRSIAKSISSLAAVASLPIQPSDKSPTGAERFAVLLQPKLFQPLTSTCAPMCVPTLEPNNTSSLSIERYRICVATAGSSATASWGNEEAPGPLVRTTEVPHITETLLQCRPLLPCATERNRSRGSLRNGASSVEAIGSAVNGI